MNKKLFDELAESLLQFGEILRGERDPSRAFERELPIEDGSTKTDLR